MKDDIANASPSSVKTVADDRRKRILVAIALVLLPLVYFFPAVMGEITLAPGDGWTQILGIRVLIGRMISQGQLPLWNPYIFAGMPLLASIQPGALYPATWLFAIFSPQTAMNVMVITTYHVALIGTYLYARRIGMSRVGAIIAGVAFSFGGYMVAHLGHSNRIAAASWLPWILLAIEELHLRLSWRWVALGALFVALQQFAGEPQMTCYTVIVAGAYGLFSLTLRRDGESRWRFLFGAAAMSVCGALISMIQLLPAREMLRLGDRAGIDYEYFSQFSFPPRQVFSLLAPYFFGGAALDPYRVSYWGDWNLTETCGYAGCIALLLALIAIISQFSAESRNRLIWFWALCAAGALFLSFGSYLPFGIHRLLYRVPIYNLFRASGRHLFEFTFAVGILAGFGASVLPKMKLRASRRVIFAGAGLMTLAVAATAVVYRFFDDRLVSQIPLPPEAGSLANPDIFVPAGFFVLGAAALLIYSRSWSSLSGAALAAMLFLELMAFGFSYEWRLVDRDVRAALADSPSVKFIKEREPDLNSFRVISHTAGDPFKNNSALINYPNISIARGLQSVNGYDPVRLGRMAEVAGAMTLDGYIADSNAFASSHQGLNLLNAKYLLYDVPGEAGARVAFDGVEFADPPMSLLLGPGVKARINMQAKATELVVISAMGASDAVANGTPVVKFRIHTAGGGVIEKELLAGRDTSEWAYDREDVKAAVKHDRARVIETWDAAGFQGHRYIARLPFDRADVTNIEVEYLLRDADITISRASLYDGGTKSSHPLNNLNLPAERWREAASFGSVRIYENLKAMPRAWFASRVAVIPSVDVLQTIKTGRMPGGAEFNSAETVLLESEIFGARDLGRLKEDPGQFGGSKGEARITRYEPQRIELLTRNERTEFLVLSEIYYRGWECWIDGKRTPVERINYALRGVIVPAGERRIEFVFMAPSFRKGAVISAAGMILLLAGWVLSRRRPFSEKRPA
ncbi:MAG: YfhO family protein [Blastocatellales bacterium]